MRLWTYRVVLPQLLNFSGTIVFLPSNLDGDKLAAGHPVVQGGRVALKPPEHHCPR